MQKKLLKLMDFVTLAIVLILFLIGITALFSANGGLEGDLSEVWKQVLWFSIGAVLVISLVIVDYTIFQKIWIPLYLIINGFLVLVLFTEPINRSNKLV